MADKFKMNPITGVLEKVTSEVAHEVGIMSKDINPHKDIENIKEDAVSAIPKIQEISIQPEDDEPIVEFKQRSQLNVVRIMDEDTGKLLGYISGYALDISFNIKELKSTRKIEQCLNGLNTLFRKIIMEQIVGKEE